MKTKPTLIFICASLFLTVFNYKAALADDSPIMQVNTDHASQNILIVLALIILVGLALWIIKNSRRLSDTADMAEPEGKEWLNKHLNDLGADQLETLIKRGDTSQKD